MAGLASALSLAGKVKSITILERSSAEKLQDRGQGIGMAPPLQQQLTQMGWLGESYNFIQTKHREWYVKDDAATSPLGRKVWTQSAGVQLHNWGVLWKELRKKVTTANYLTGKNVESVEFGSDGVHLRGSDNQDFGTFDFVIAADGASSVLRKIVLPDSSSNLAEYVLWRGSFPMDNAHASKILDLDYCLRNQVWITAGYPGGHGIAYSMPATESNDKYLINWAYYSKMPPGIGAGSSTAVRNIPEEAMEFFQEHVVSYLPPWFADLTRIHSESISIHFILDESPKTFCHPSSRLLLVGDAGAVLRPHTASGTTKALQDAMALGALAKADGITWTEVSQQYEKERKVEAENLVKMGRRFGDFQVVNAPDWANMSESDFQDWAAAMVSGTSNYMWKKEKE